MTERKTGFLLKEKLPKGKQSKALADMVIRLLWPFKQWERTITSDNWTEFAGHKRIARKQNAGFYCLIAS